MGYVTPETTGINNTMYTLITPLETIWGLEEGEVGHPILNLVLFLK